MPSWNIAAFTHRGLVRPTNQDTIAVNDHVLNGDMTTPLAETLTLGSCVLLIGDGLGGHAGGALASLTAVTQLANNADALTSAETCAATIQRVSDHLYRMMEENPTVLGMGTTIVGAVLTSDYLLTFNAGDSRAYLQSHDLFIQLTVDDVAREPEGHRRSHQLSQALGGSESPSLVFAHVNTDPPLRANEALLLCSDGLTDTVSDAAIAEILRQIVDPASAVRKLAEQAFTAGGVDNISLVVARLASGPGHQPNLDRSPRGSGKAEQT